jgi:hypothetical protein
MNSQVAGPRSVYGYGLLRHGSTDVVAGSRLKVSSLDELGRLAWCYIPRYRYACLMPVLNERVGENQVPVNVSGRDALILFFFAFPSLNSTLSNSSGNSFFPQNDPRAKEREIERKIWHFYKPGPSPR